MKWIRTNHKLPKDGQCVFVVFEHEPGSTATWYAQYKMGSGLEQIFLMASYTNHCLGRQFAGCLSQKTHFAMERKVRQEL